MDGKFFSISELTYSNTAKAKGIDNSPTQEHKENLSILIKELLDPIRAIYGKPITISSGYRSNRLNSALSGSSSTSNHMIGCAADCVCDDIDALFEIAKDFDFDECFKESADKYDKNNRIIGKSYWLHLAYRKGKNRKKVGIVHNHKFL